MRIRNIFAATIPPSRLAAAHLPLHKGGFGAVRIAMLNYNLPQLQHSGGKAEADVV
jgi:hypothetical protein